MKKCSIVMIILIGIQLNAFGMEPGCGEIESVENGGISAEDTATSSVTLTEDENVNNSITAAPVWDLVTPKITLRGKCYIRNYIPKVYGEYEAKSRTFDANNNNADFKVDFLRAELVLIGYDGPVETVTKSEKRSCQNCNVKNVRLERWNNPEDIAKGYHTAKHNGVELKVTTRVDM